MSRKERKTKKISVTSCTATTTATTTTATATTTTATTTAAKTTTTTPRFKAIVAALLHSLTPLFFSFFHFCWKKIEAAEFFFVSAEKSSCKRISERDRTKKV